MATWLRKTAEYEADLFTIQKTWWKKLFMRSKKGEMEIKLYDNGEKHMEIDLHGIKVPNGARLQAMIDGKTVRDVTIQRGYARLRYNSADGEIIPEVQHGSKAEIHYIGELLLEGKFFRD
jgi:hypothetical protein